VSHGWPGEHWIAKSSAISIPWSAQAETSRRKSSSVGQALLFPRRRYRRVYLSLTVLRDQGRSIYIIRRELAHGSEPGKPHSRARLRDLDLAWLRTRSGRSALACGGARNLD